jgi:hypothetical protein
MLTLVAPTIMFPWTSILITCCRSFSRSVGMPPLTSLLDLLVALVGIAALALLCSPAVHCTWRLTPVICIAGSTGLSVLLFNSFSSLVG